MPYISWLKACMLGWHRVNKGATGEGGGRRTKSRQLPGQACRAQSEVRCAPARQDSPLRLSSSPGSKERYLCSCLISSFSIRCKTGREGAGCLSANRERVISSEDGKNKKKEIKNTEREERGTPKEQEAWVAVRGKKRAISTQHEIDPWQKERETEREIRPALLVKLLLIGSSRCRGENDSFA